MRGNNGSLRQNLIADSDSREVPRVAARHRQGARRPARERLRPSAAFTRCRTSTGCPRLSGPPRSAYFHTIEWSDSFQERCT